MDSMGAKEMTDTINVPRKLLERIIGKMNIVWQKTDETEELRTLLQAPAQPAPKAYDPVKVQLLEVVMPDDNADQRALLALVIESNEVKHGGLRAAAKALGIDPAYLSRLKSGEKTNPSAEVLAAFGLERYSYYRPLLAAAPQPPVHGYAGRHVHIGRLKPIKTCGCGLAPAAQGGE